MHATGVHIEAKKMIVKLRGPQKFRFQILNFCLNWNFQKYKLFCFIFIKKIILVIHLLDSVTNINKKFIWKSRIRFFEVSLFFEKQIEKCRLVFLSQLQFLN